MHTLSDTAVGWRMVAYPFVHVVQGSQESDRHRAAYCLLGHGVHFWLLGANGGGPLPSLCNASLPAWGAEIVPGAQSPQTPLALRVQGPVMYPCPGAQTLHGEH